MQYQPSSVALSIKKSKKSVSDAQEPARSELNFPGVYDGADALPVVDQENTMASYDGQMVRLVGKYTEADVRMKPVGEPKYIGHVSIVLEDNTRIALFPVWKDDARRPKAEVERFKDKKVVVIGTLYQRSPADPRGGASPLSPCLTDIQALYLYGE